MEQITTKEQAIELIEGIVRNERFKVDAYFFCGFPTDQPNEKLIKVCEIYLEKRNPETKSAMLSEMERITYLRELGWEVDEEPIESMELALPEELTGSYAAYNELQLAQGFDLRDYLGKSVSRWTYQVRNYPDRPEDVQLNLYLCEDRPIAGDIIAGGEGGFQGTLRYPGE